MVNRDECFKLIEIINNSNIIIYGTGYVARNFYTALQIRHLDHKVDCFTVTLPDKSKGNINGIPIKSIDNVIQTKGSYICIAVHEAIKDEIENYLIEHNIEKYIWVHPYIMELALGMPREYHRKIKTRNIIQRQGYNNYLFAVRYLAIDHYYKKNDIGYQLYLKALSLQCEQVTAQKRLERFIELIDSWRRDGYQQEQDIWIDETYRLVDGTHRLSLACYHVMEDIYCTVFPYSDNYDRVVKDTHILSMELLVKSGFSTQELTILKKTQAMIRKRL